MFLTYYILDSKNRGYVIQRRATTPNQKKWICTGAGLGMVAVVCRMNMFHSLVTTFVNSLIIKFSNKRHCPTLSFVFVFTYLAFFRTTHYFGLPAPTSFSNVVQLLLTLRMVGIAFEVQDSWKAKEEISKSEKKDVDNRTLMAVIDTPGMLDVFMYAYCYIGILTGPYYKYKVYADMINQKQGVNIPTLKPAVHRLKYIIPYGGAYLILSQYFVIDYLRTDAFYDNPFWYRYLFMVPVFIVFRLRMFSAWVLSEVVCILAGLGAYPKETNPKCAQGPTQSVPQDSESTNYEYNFDTIRNIDGYNCDTTSTLRDAMRYWNMTVQWWLKHYIYIRCPIKSLRTSITLLVSAFWHGIHPGYFLSFLTIPIMLTAEDVMIQAFRTDENARVYRKLNWFFRSRGLDYLAMGFLLLTWNDTIRFWKSVYFIPHLFSALFIIVGLVFKPKQSYRKLKEAKESIEKVSDSIGKKTD
ncbi:lysophospholipid acyltransferase 7-like isoform X2 [Anneissia japonica]|uniref:lysophospholipid acyltransferase 7-like isoform X2 n=1 Tax=Anneissia japonica TaxID=1529436 RepID=UPI001425A0DB|nr:lysophospholipid acyltransferase 7-like isoform X2 [Anneissia japonica]